MPDSEHFHLISAKLHIKIIGIIHIEVHDEVLDILGFK